MTILHKGNEIIYIRRAGIEKSKIKEVEVFLLILHGSYNSFSLLLLNTNFLSIFLQQSMTLVLTQKISSSIKKKHFVLSIDRTIV